MTRVVVIVLVHLMIMKLQVKSQTTTIVNREATEMTLVLGRRIPMKGDVLFQVAIVVGLERAVSAVETELNKELEATSLNKDA